jgi:outer membrane protease
MFIGLSYMRFKWTARDGYYQYAKEISSDIYEPWDNAIEKIPLYGPAIAYSQEWLFFTLGSSLHIPLFDFLTLEFSFQLGPAVFCMALDDHLESGKKIQYNDYVFRGIMIEPRTEWVFFPRQRVSLSLYCGYRLIKGGRGESFYRPSGSGGDRIFNSSADFDSAGAGYKALDTGIALKLQF